MNNKEKFNKILLIPYCHADFAWTNRREWHITRYIECLLLTLDLMKINPDYTFCIDNITHFLKPFLINFPDRYEELKQRINEGRIYLANGGYALLRPSYSGEETFLRNLVKGKRELKSLSDRDINFYFNADTAGGHSQLAQILSLSGHKYYRYFRSEAGQNYRSIPREYKLLGGNNTSVIVNRGNYILSFLETINEKCNFDRDWEKIRKAFYRLDINDKENLSIGGTLMLFLAYDDILPYRSGFDTPIRLTDFINEWNKRENCKIYYAVPEDYYKILEKKDIPVLNEAPEQVELSFNIPFKGNNSFWKLRKKLANTLIRLESLDAILHACEIDNQIQLESLWTSLYEISGHAIEYTLVHDNDELFSLGMAALLTADNLFKSNMEILATKVGRKGSYLLVNTTGNEFDGIVPVHVTNVFGVNNPVAYDINQNPLKYQIVEAYRGDKEYTTFSYQGIDVAVKVKIPPLGFTTVNFENRDGHNWNLNHLPPKSGKTPILDLIMIECGLCQFKINSRGIESIIMNGKEIQFSCGLSFIKTKPDKTWISSYKPQATNQFITRNAFQINAGPLVNIIQLDGSIGKNKASQTIIFRYNCNYIDIKTKIVSAGEEGYYTADFKADETTEIYADIPYGIEKRELSKELCFSGGDSSDSAGFSEQSIPGQFYGTNFCLYRSCGISQSIISKDCSIYYIHNQEEIKLILNRNLERNKRGRKPTDLWFQQLPETISGEGAHEYNYAVCFEQDIYKIPQIVKQLVNPPISVKKFNEECGLEEFSLFRVSNLMVITACTSYKKNSYLLRLYNPVDETIAFSLDSAKKVKEVVKVDLLEQPINYINDYKQIISGPREIMTLIIKV